MYTLYWSKRTRAVSVRMALEESGIPYQLHTLDMSKDDHKSPEYLAINPKGFVPTLISDAGEVFTETPAMLMHIMDILDLDKSGRLAPSAEDPLRGKFLDWFSYHLIVLQDPYKRFYFPDRYSSNEAHIDGIKESAALAMEEYWDTIESHLAENGPYHLGDRFSIIDILLATFAVFVRWKPDFFKSYPAVTRCFEQVKARPRLTAILQEHEEPSDKSTIRE